MQQRGSPRNVEPSQSAPLPDKPVADQPGEPRQSRAETSVLIAVSVYHRLKNVSLNWVYLTVPSCGSPPQRSTYSPSYPVFRRRRKGYLQHMKEQTDDEANP